MAEVEMSTEEESHPRNPINNEEGNLKDGEIWVNLNESQDNKSELQRTGKELQSNLKRVKKDNERILKAQEELNNILLAKRHNDEKEKNKEFEHIIPKTTPYKCKRMKLEFFCHKAETYSEESVKHHTKNNTIPMKVVMIIKIKRSTNHMNKYIASVKILNHQCLMVKLKKEKKQKPGCQG